MNPYRPSEIILEDKPPSLSELDLDASVIDTKKHYEKQLKKLQQKMLTVQQAYFHQERRAVLVFEGWDAAGKGGAIRRLTEGLDPRGFHVHAIAAPTHDEQGRHYLYRFFNRLPKPGSLCIFDRSYYGRVLVERVEKFCSKSEWQRGYHEINEFERMLIDDGVRVVKVFLHIDQDEQLRRFKERLQNPLKRWKLTKEDLRNRSRWPKYERAINEMLEATSTTLAPWNVVAANHKWFARLEVLELVTSALANGVDIAPPPLDPEIQKLAMVKLGIQP